MFASRILTLFTLTVGVGFCQIPEPEALLRDVARAAADIQSWRIEGSIEDSNFPGSDIKFTFLQHAPNQSRFEQTGGENPAIIICDGQKRYTWSPQLNRYTEDELTNDSGCSPILQEWAQLPFTLESPIMTGEGNYIVGGRTLTCSLVQGSSRPELASVGMLKRTVCIDPIHKVIVGAKTETKWGSRKYFYSTIELNTEPDPQAFVFHPPAGSQMSYFRLPVPRPIGSVALPEPDVTQPKVKSSRPLDYDEAARKARVEGTVVLYLIVDEHGVPSDIQVYRPLYPGLDANSVETVRKWRFKPALKNGQPVAVPILLECNYRLAH